MSEREGYCETCGGPIKEHKHGLSIGLARALFKTARHQREHGSPVLLSEVGLTYSERCNHQKLQYWEMILKADDPSRKGGWWYVTEKGFQFLRGELAVPHFVWTFRAKIIGYEGKMTYIMDITEGWRWRPDYIRDARPHV